MPYPVLVGICLDAEAIWTGQNPEAVNRPVMLSQGTFAINEGLGAAAGPARRLPGAGHVLRAGRDGSSGIRTRCGRSIGRGHELASHTFSHRSVLTLGPGEERQELARGHRGCCKPSQACGR